MQLVRAGAVLVAGCLGAALGCGRRDGESGVTAAGTVTVNGEPLPRGQIVFESPGQDPRIGVIAEGGRFEVAGVTPGTNRVAVRTSMFQGREMAEKKYAKKAGKGTVEKAVVVDAKYENPATSGVEVTVEAGKELAITLKDSPAAGAPRPGRPKAPGG